jgi:hypothetical protein
MHPLVERLLALDLMTTSLEGDDWCIEVDRALQDAAREIERLTTSLNLSTDQNGATVRNVHRQPERHQ